MKPIYLLIAAVLLALGAGFWLIQKPANNEFEPQLLFTDLAPFVNEIQSVEIENAQGVLFSAEKSAENWQAIIAPQMPGYPVSQDELADLVSTLLQLKLIEPKTNKVKNYYRLGLQDITITDSLASLVTLKTRDKTWSVLVGNNVSFADGSYVRLPNNKQSWRTDKSIQLPLDKYSWLKQPILPFEAEDIVAISRVDNPQWQMVKQEDGNFSLNPMPHNRELEYQGILDSMLSSLLNLHFEQLYVSEELDGSILNAVAELALETSQGEMIKVLLSDMDGKFLVSFQSDLASEYWQKWHYLISHFSAQQLIKISEDFLAEKNEPLTEDTLDNAKAVEEGESPH